MEIHPVSVLGLLLIAAGWLVQLRAMKGGQRGVSARFVALNCAGIFLLVADSAASGSYDIAAMNCLTLLASLLVLRKAL
jgi:uncharacterized membrane protein